MLIVGEKEEADEMLSVRKHGGEDLGTMNISEFARLINDEVKASMQKK